MFETVETDTITGTVIVPTTKDINKINIHLFTHQQHQLTQQRNRHLMFKRLNVTLQKLIIFNRTTSMSIQLSTQHQNDKENH